MWHPFVNCELTASVRLDWGFDVNAFSGEGEVCSSGRVWATAGTMLASVCIPESVEELLWHVLNEVCVQRGPYSGTRIPPWVQRVRCHVFSCSSRAGWPACGWWVPWGSPALWRQLPFQVCSLWLDLGVQMPMGGLRRAGGGTCCGQCCPSPMPSAAAVGFARELFWCSASTQGLLRSLSLVGTACYVSSVANGDARC